MPQTGSVAGRFDGSIVIPLTGSFICLFGLEQQHTLPPRFCTAADAGAGTVLQLASTTSAIETFVLAQAPQTVISIFAAFLARCRRTEAFGRNLLRLCKGLYGDTTEVNLFNRSAVLTFEIVNHISYTGTNRIRKLRLMTRIGSLETLRVAM
jgi:hypothetical protein